MPAAGGRGHRRRDSRGSGAISTTTVVNLHTTRRESWDKLIARPSPWGNPFRVGVDGIREECVALYLTSLLEQPRLLARLPELRGKRLTCWCHPQLCHGHVLAMLAEETAPR